MTEPQTASQINGPQVGSVEPLLEWTHNESRALPIEEACKALEAYRVLQKENAELKAKLAAFEESLQRERGPKWEAELMELADRLEILGRLSSVNSDSDRDRMLHAAEQLRYMAQFKEAMQREKQTEWHAEVKSQADWLAEFSRECGHIPGFEDHMLLCSILLNNLWQSYTHKANFVPIHLAIKEAHWLLDLASHKMALRYDQNHLWLERCAKWLKEVEEVYKV